jgi:hypothetical protein
MADLLDLTVWANISSNFNTVNLLTNNSEPEFSMSLVKYREFEFSPLLNYKVTAQLVSIQFVYIAFLTFLSLQI